MKFEIDYSAIENSSDEEDVPLTRTNVKRRKIEIKGGALGSVLFSKESSGSSTKEDPAYSAILQAKREKIEERKVYDASKRRRIAEEKAKLEQRQIRMRGKLAFSKQQPEDISKDLAKPCSCHNQCLR